MKRAIVGVLSCGLAFTLAASAQPPVITAVVNGASFQPDFASNTWVTIFGENLASTTRTWNQADFVNGALPTSLDGVSVTTSPSPSVPLSISPYSSLPAYVEYISPTQSRARTTIATSTCISTTRRSRPTPMRRSAIRSAARPVWPATNTAAKTAASRPARSFTIAPTGRWRRRRAYYGRCCSTHSSNRRRSPGRCRSTYSAI